MSYLVRAYCSISPTRYYKDDSCWSADLKSNTTTEDVISIGSFMEVLVLNHYVLVRKLLHGYYKERKKGSKLDKHGHGNGKSAKELEDCYQWST
ncbi:hypothetical protein Tco_0755981 [Tanacetum coccineum]